MRNQFNGLTVLLFFIWASGCDASGEVSLRVALEDCWTLATAMSGDWRNDVYELTEDPLVYSNTRTTSLVSCTQSRVEVVGGSEPVGFAFNQIPVAAPAETLTVAPDSEYGWVNMPQTDGFLIAVDVSAFQNPTCVIVTHRATSNMDNSFFIRSTGGDWLTTHVSPIGEGGEAGRRAVVLDSALSAPGERTFVFIRNRERIPITQVELRSMLEGGACDP